MFKYSVLTCVFGNGYDNLIEIKNKNENVEYICVTDNPNLVSSTWNIILADKMLLSLPFTNQWTYVRYHPYEFVSTNVCLYIDATIEIIDDFTNILIEPFANSEKEYQVLMHPWRNNIFDETNEWVKQRNYPIEVRNIIFKRLLNEGYNIKGLIQSTILLTKNTKDTNRINNRTWEMCHNWAVNSEVDRNNQADLTYVINTLYYDSPKIGVMSMKVIHSNYLHWTQHGTGEYYGDDGYCSNIFFDKENNGIII